MEPSEKDRLEPDCLGPLAPWDDTRLPELLDAMGAVDFEPPEPVREDETP